jgi:hypothetical protein
MYRQHLDIPPIRARFDNDAKTVTLGWIPGVVAPTTQRETVECIRAAFVRVRFLHAQGYTFHLHKDVLALIKFRPIENLWDIG